MKKRDIFVIASILIFAVLLYVVIIMTRTEGATVIVEVNNEEVAKYPLDKDGEFELNGGTNILKIEDGKAWIIAADCPDKKCMYDFRPIKYHGETITCLPNKLVVKISSDELPPGVDLVS